MLQHSVKLTKEEVDRFVKARKQFEETQSDIVAGIAIRLGVHPAGYGMYGEKIVYDYTERAYMAQWSRSPSCD